MSKTTATKPATSSKPVSTKCYWNPVTALVTTVPTLEALAAKYKSNVKMDASNTVFLMWTDTLIDQGKMTEAASLYTMITLALRSNHLANAKTDEKRYLAVGKRLLAASKPAAPKPAAIKSTVVPVDSKPATS